jgi:hypothetical protein
MDLDSSIYACQVAVMTGAPPCLAYFLRWGLPNILPGLTSTCNLLISAPQETGTTGMSHSAQSYHTFLFFIVHLFTCAYIAWVISPPCPPPPPFLHFPPQFQIGPVLPLSLILLKKKHKHNREDKAFFLVELRIVTQRDSYYCFRVPMCYNPCWFNSDLYIGSWSPAHDNLSF